MDKINKALLKLSSKQRAMLLADFAKVIEGEMLGLDIRKMKGHADLYRLRSGNVRLIYKQVKSMKPVIIHIGKRDDQTYRDF